MTTTKDDDFTSAAQAAADVVSKINTPQAPPADDFPMPEDLKREKPKDLMAEVRKLNERTAKATAIKPPASRHHGPGVAPDNLKLPAKAAKIGPKEQAHREAREEKAKGAPKGAPKGSKLAPGTAKSRIEPASKSVNAPPRPKKPDFKASTAGGNKPKALPAKAPTAKPKGNGGESKTDIAIRMLQRKNGATRKEIAEAVDWPSINLKPIAKRHGMKLIEKDGRLSLS